MKLFEQLNVIFAFLVKMISTKKARDVTHIVIHVWAVKMSIFLVFVAGLLWGFLIGVLVLV